MPQPAGWAGKLTGGPSLRFRRAPVRPAVPEKFTGLPDTALAPIDAAADVGRYLADVRDHIPGWPPETGRAPPGRLLRKIERSGIHWAIAR